MSHAEDTACHEHHDRRSEVFDAEFGDSKSRQEQQCDRGDDDNQRVPAARSGRVRAALEHWAASCGAIVEERKNQPSLVDALKQTLGRAGCRYDEDPRNTTAAVWPEALAAPLVVLNQDLFVSGRRAAFAREAKAKNALLAFHANFLFGWRAKCEKLRRLGLLFVDVADGDVCRDQGASESRVVTCKSR